MPQTVAEHVKRLAAVHGIAVDLSDGALRMSVAFSRLEGIEGDETLLLMAELYLHGCISKDDAYSMIERHDAECEPDQGRDLETVAPGPRHDLGSV